MKNLNKLTPLTYVLQSLQVRLIGFVFVIDFLKLLEESLISVGIIFPISGPR